MSNTRDYDYCRNITQQELSKIISKKQLAQMIGKSESTVSRMIKDGRLPKPLLTPQGYSGGWFSATLHEWFNNSN
ncbi:helix-turn-helix transcriptional regulator [Vibrio parahaemolyticus]|uniref:helix-turn-helix transcriptional regulator n=1 Tax=Vibrio parahaemolyticus TaxID=670 RepID=UPI0011239766|nr:Cox family DNA-binding protein [Vibrio parahaemolyticus]MBE3844225.1 helix-turn-helix domain-containing protein [Vibrio parahaemolyticus]MBE3945143.1 helix-turn-helix domain-containing protein [Vibrio parahaemolyticus]MBE4119972.1 helix-turn-helix domain-containing protein [Vibrio parahaemolyticus]MBE4439545.1 helix-turn-helix domain-containing protein [Vibrio parahaemolyticus]MBE4780764.1 helix-turn-helix domain-containing protein [Vibrio parahaemolyticus]